MRWKGWAFVFALAWGWFSLLSSCSEHDKHGDKWVHRECELAGPGLTFDPYTQQAMQVPALESEACAKIRDEAEAHDRGIDSHYSGQIFGGIFTLLFLSTIIHIFKVRHREVLETIRSNPQTEIYMGDVFRDNNNTTINNRNTNSLNNSYNSMKSIRPELSDAMIDLAKLVDKSGNKVANKLFEQIVEEAGKPKPVKSELRSCWDALLAALPTIKDSIEVFHVISNFVAGV